MLFTRFAWAVVGYNLLVVLWGAYVRATGSGAGCGGAWPLCNGDVIPRSHSAAAMIEYTHRITSGLALASAAALWLWARRLFPRGDRVRRYAGLSVVFILVEALLGAGLVLFELTGANTSPVRAVYLAAHLTNTLVLLAMLAAAAFHSRPLPAPPPRPRPVTWAVPVLLAVAITGAVAALGDTPGASTPALVRLRVFHPTAAVAGALFLLWAATAAARLKIGLAAWAAFVLVFAQMVAGAVNVALRAPVWMQLVHLLIADLLWLALVVVYLSTRARHSMRSATAGSTAAARLAGT